MNPSSNAQPKIAEMYPGIYQPSGQAEGQGGPDLPMQPLNTLLGFDLETYQVPLDHLLPSKKIMDGTMSTRKYKQVVSSIHEIGLIEPLSVIQPDPKKSEFLLLDGHLRVLALKELGMQVAPCLMAKDDESYSYNHMLNRLSTVQEHYMLRRAIDRGVSRERLARAFNVNLSSINRRINLLEGICPEAIDLLQDKQFTPDVTRILRNMKAARQVAEMVLQALAEVNAAVAAQGGRAPRAKTTFSMVRFGNVLGSSGSVVPLFREQIKNGGPITLTHADITRYFMTIPEAAQLVIQAGAMGQGGDVFVLDMGQPVKIIDLARRMVELSGMTVRDEQHPDGDIELTVTGLRPGEKLYEELLIGDNPKPTQHPRIMKAHEQFLSWAELEQKLNALSIAMSVNDVPVIRGMLQELVSGYQPSGEVVDWVHMALEREALANE